MKSSEGILAAVLILLVFGLTTGKGGYTLLAAVLLLAGMAALFVYLGISAYRNTKKRGKLVREMLGKYGKEALLRVCIGENITYSFNGITKTVSFGEIEKRRHVADMEGGASERQMGGCPALWKMKTECI